LIGTTCKITLRIRPPYSSILERSRTLGGQPITGDRPSENRASGKSLSGGTSGSSVGTFGPFGLRGFLAIGQSLLSAAGKRGSKRFPHTHSRGVPGVCQLSETPRY